MDDDPISGLLELENLFLDTEVIRLLSYDAATKGRRVKAFIDGKEPFCDSFFLNDPGVDWASGGNDSICIAQFKSDRDNARLQASDNVMLAYEHGRFNLEARRLAFQEETKIGRNAAFRLSLPRIFQVASRRKLVRHRIPSGMSSTVTVVRKRGKVVKKLRGILFDINAEGLCFAAPASGVVFEKDDQVKLDIETKNQHFGEIHTIVNIMSKTQYRQAEGSRHERIFYGCKLMSVNNSHKLNLFIDDIKARETDVRKASKTSELTKELFGKIKKRRP